jgi:hypothetical protein
MRSGKTALLGLRPKRLSGGGVGGKKFPPMVECKDFLEFKCFFFNEAFSCVKQIRVKFIRLKSQLFGHMFINKTTY